MTCSPTPAPSPCEPLVRERLRYFTGRNMTARDFRDADAYHRGMRHLHNRVLHGWGVARGLEVEPHANPECGVIVHCGMAIDCCGREVVLPQAQVQRIPWDRLARTASDGPDPHNAPGKPAEVLVLCLEYVEELTEKVPVLYSRDACSGAHYEEGRIREGCRLHWHVIDESKLPGYGWHLAQGCPPDTPDTPCEPCAPAQSSCCGDEPCAGLSPRCSPDHCVVLAVVRGNERVPVIDTDGRRCLPHAQENLTHICWISWPHGGLMKLSDFTQLSVRFDRALAAPGKNPDAAGPVGINECTFVAQAGGQREDLDFVMYIDRPPHLLPDRRTAVFDVLNPKQYLNQTIYVTLRCDFILDCRGNPVDGNHLRGQCPTGDGIPGGTFESWFRVVRDDDYQRLMQAAGTPGAPA